MKNTRKSLITMHADEMHKVNGGTTADKAWHTILVPVIIRNYPHKFRGLEGLHLPKYLRIFFR